MAADAQAACGDQRGRGWLEQLWNRAEGLRHRGPRQARPGWLAPLAARTASRGLRAQPLTVAGVVAGAGLMLGAALAFRGRPSRSPEDPEEIIARALCREAPDTPTHRGPLWTGYRKDARRVLAALRAAGWLSDKV